MYTVCVCTQLLFGCILVTLSAAPSTRLDSTLLLCPPRRHTSHMCHFMQRSTPAPRSNNVADVDSSPLLRCIGLCKLAAGKSPWWGLFWFLGRSCRFSLFLFLFFICIIALLCCARCSALPSYATGVGLVGRFGLCCVVVYSHTHIYICTYIHTHTYVKFSCRKLHTSVQIIFSSNVTKS